MKVCCFMPVYNTDEGYFRQAIESILNQTYKDFELLIIDDGSRAYIQEIVNSYKDPRIKYHRMPINGGIIAASRVGLKLAKAGGAQYFARLDSDDIALPDRFEKQVAFLDSHPAFGACSSNSYCFNEKDEWVGDSHTYVPDEIKVAMLFKNTVCNSSGMARLSVIKKNNIHYKEYPVCEDYIFWSDLSKYSKLYYFDQPLVKYRIHEESITHTRWQLCVNSAITAQTKLFQYYFQSVSKDQILQVVQYIHGVGKPRRLAIYRTLKKMKFENKKKQLLNKKYLDLYMRQYFNGITFKKIFYQYFCKFLACFMPLKRYRVCIRNWGK